MAAVNPVRRGAICRGAVGSLDPIHRFGHRCIKTERCPPNVLPSATDYLAEAL